MMRIMSYEVERTDDEWRSILDEDAYIVLRKKGTEYAFRNAYWDNLEKGLYLCAGCGNELFSSEHKYDSGTGWPSFWETIRPGAVEAETDRSSGLIRTEVRCSKCGGHLGHLFDDGPGPTRSRYCMNSGALKFGRKK
jgi:peptide-methionine (R)-S-oxide reductase